MCILNKGYVTTQTSLFLLALCILVLTGLQLKHFTRQQKPISTISKTYKFNNSNYLLSLNERGQSFWRSLKPNIECPPNLLALTDNSRNSGKWTCGLSKLELLREPQYNHHLKNAYEPCLVYSFGVNYDSFWEAEVLATTHCSVYAYDPTVDSIGKPLKSSNKRVHFSKLGLGGSNTRDKKTLATFMEMNGHENSLIHILKLDIEGWEFPALENILKDFPNDVPVAQLLVEFHVWDWSLSIKAKNVIDLFTALEKRGIRLFHVDNYGIDQRTRDMCTEFSFINEKYLDLFGFS